MKWVSLKIDKGIIDEATFHMGIDNCGICDDISLGHFFEQFAGALELVGGKERRDYDIVGEGVRVALGFDDLGMD